MLTFRKTQKQPSQKKKKKKIIYFMLYKLCIIYLQNKQIYKNQHLKNKLKIKHQNKFEKSIN